MGEYVLIVFVKILKATNYDGINERPNKETYFYLNYDQTALQVDFFVHC